ncbi:MAG: NIPSNAP family protein [Dehalococcoidia bacterium]
MIYEMRTYTLKPGTVPDFEAGFAEALPHRQKYSKLGAFWHTEVGPLNQVIHVWPYEDLAERAQVRDAAVQDPNWPPKTGEFVVSQETEILLPAPFMPPMEPREMGAIYEMRIYTFQPGTIPEVLKRWEESMEYRVKYSPLAACWYSEVGGLNRFFHVWPYRDFAERERVRQESRQSGHWPPATREFLVRQENKILAPAAFSPLK